MTHLEWFPIPTSRCTVNRMLLCRVNTHTSYIVIAEPTLTYENVLEVLQSVPAKKWDDLAFALQIPISKRDQIEKQFRTPEQRREALVTYWLQVGPNASWEMLAGALYFWEKYAKAVEATKDYLPEFKGIR